jgi:hypothetical protein
VHALLIEICDPEKRNGKEEEEEEEEEVIK